MAGELKITSAMGTALSELLTHNDDIQPGAALSYDLCKNIYIFHPLGRKLVEKPIEIAQSQKREVSVPNSPEERVKEAFEDEWERLRVDTHIMNLMRIARVYGVGSLAVVEDGVDVSKPLDFNKVYKAQIAINAYDPLNTAGSLVLHQDPLAMDFQHVMQIAVSGQPFHRTRSIVQMNEAPIYIHYTASAYGFVGRSVFQRSLFPMKSFLRTMETNDLVATKIGVLVAKIKQPGSIINNAMIKLFGQKRQVVKEAQTGGVISISPDEAIESLNFQNLDGPMEIVRKSILEDIASACGMPAKMLTEETFAEGFGEGTEDAKAIARYIDGVREEMQPVYDWFDRLVMYRAWNPDFYKTIQAEYTEYANVEFAQAFYEWKNSFTTKWPSLLKEPDSELVKVDEVKLRAVLAFLQLMLPQADPDNKARLIEWAVDNFNSLKFLFDTPLELDYEELANFTPEPQVMPGMGAQGAHGPPGGGMMGGGKPGMGGGGGGMGGGGQKMQGMSFGSMAQMGRSHANDAAVDRQVEQFMSAVDRMLARHNKPRLRVVEK
jgi:hypothetical protein